MNLKNSLSKLSLQDWIFVVFSILWVGIIVLDYLNKQVIYIPSITHFKYFGLFSFFGLFGAFLSAYYNKIGPFKKWISLRVNGLVVLALVLLSICLITLAYNQYWQAPLDYTNYLHLIGKGIFTLGCSFLVVTAAYSSGTFLRAKFLPSAKITGTFVLVDICLGFIIYTFIMMFLGAFALLNQIVLLGIILLMLLVNYKSTLWFVKKALWTPIKRPEDLHFWGGMLAFFILIYITMNYMYTQAPYPLGFDSRNYYVNISKLIGESGALVPGFQPYAWSLVMSTGYIAFKSTEITLFLSALGGILSLFAIYHFCRKYINISSNYSLTVVLLYLITPTVTNHFIIEFKVDLSLVFFQIVSLIFLMWWIFDSHSPAKKRTSLIQSRSDLHAISILGLLLGYCLSIKVLSVFLIFGIIVGLWYYHRDIYGVIGISAISIGIILIAGLDNLSGLRDYHLSPTYSGLALVVSGSLFVIWSFIKSKTHFLESLKVTTLCGAVSLLTFSPWIYKNYTYTKSTSIIKLFMGEKPKPQMDFFIIDENYRRYLEENK